MRSPLTLLAAACLVAACSDMTRYEEAVADHEPVYCYRSLGGVQCFDSPNHRDERRMVNFYGPAPRTYDRPAPSPIPTYHAPDPVDFFVKDPEPIPAPALASWPQAADLPWLQATGAAPAGVSSPVGGSGIGD